jgi:tetratricopeptide (TPR) repeat protein
MPISTAIRHAPRLAAALFVLGLALPAPHPAGAQVKPTAEERADIRDELFAALKAAPDEDAARKAADSIWRFWITGPTREATLLLEDAMARRESFDYAGALAALDLLIEMTPDWSEAWNQRAFVRFLREDYEGSLADIERTLELEPKHFGALAGKARILFLRGEMQRGQEVLRAAVDIHPWLAERALLQHPPGRDI